MPDLVYTFLRKFGLQKPTSGYIIVHWSLINLTRVRTMTEILSRVLKLKERPIKYVYNKCFDDGKMRRNILEPMPNLADFEERRRKINKPKEMDAETAVLYQQPLLNKDQEQHLFRKMNYLYHTAKKTIESINENKPRELLVKKSECLLKEADEIKQLVIICNVRLAWRFAARQSCSPHAKSVTMSELFAEANISLLRATECFDYSLQTKFSTYSSWCIIKNYHRFVPNEMKWHSRLNQNSMTIIHNIDKENSHEIDIEKEEQINKLHQVMEDLLNQLEPRKRKAVRAYYGFESGEKKTLKEIAEMLSVTKERARQLRNQGTKLLRDIAKEKNLSLEDILCGTSL
jgi:RNA polymerase sigma factor (sigma-70 family)